MEVTIMKDEKETRVKLLNSAKAEFLNKGFMKASLRNICKNAGVTTGALYFFFKDKDDLFVSLVKEIIEKVYKIMNDHYEEEKKRVGTEEFLKTDMSKDYEDSFKVIHEIYSHKDEFLLLIEKSQGSSVENVLDDIIKISDKHYRMLAEALSEKYSVPLVQEQFIHWMSHMQIDIFIYMVTHIDNEEEAKIYMSQAMAYMLNGWCGIFNIK